MREIVFDTETTGFDFSRGDRLVEIGCIELVNRVETGLSFHAYHHPERSMPPEAAAVHGLTDAFLSDKPLFHTRADELLAFLGDSPLVAHNATFDFGFLNGELERCGRPPIALDRMVDTLPMARTRHPGAKHTLDAQLLAQVYVELTGGRQIGLGLLADRPAAAAPTVAAVPRIERPPRVFDIPAGELAAHQAFISTLADPLWGSAERR